MTADMIELADRMACGFSATGRGIADMMVPVAMKVDHRFLKL